MNRTFLLIFVLISIMSLSAAFGAEPVGDGTSFLSSDDLFLADTPIIYGEEAFLERLSRSKESGDPLGLVLSGGSARAFAHIGVLKYLEERGIVPDFIVSNSMGSIVGLLYGAGLSPDQIYQLIASTDIGSLFTLTVPFRGGILDVSRFSDLLYSYLGDLDLSELPVPVMVVCEDLKTKRQILITEGDFYDIMEASYALPVYFSPVPYRDHLLIDGGITNLVPLSFSYRYTDKIIASTTFYANPNLDLHNPLTILNVSIDIGKRREGVEELLEYSPILIRSNVESFSFMDFDSLKDIYQAGYQSAALMGDALGTLYAGGLNDEQKAVREEFEPRDNRAGEAFYHFGFIPARDPHGRISIDTESFAAPMDDTPYHDDLFLSAGYLFNTRTTEGALRFGYSVYPYEEWDLQNTGQVDFSWLLTPRIEAVGSGRVAFETDLSSLISTQVGGSLTDVLYSQKPYTLELEFDTAFRHNDHGADTSYISAALASLYGNAHSSADSYGSMRVGYRFEDLTSHVLFGEFSGVVRTSSPFRFDLSGVGSLPLNPGALVRFFRRDMFRSSLTPGRYEKVLGGSIGLDLEPLGKDVSFAEFILVKDLTVGLYGDMLLTDSLSWGAGVRTEMLLSVIGLKSTSLELFGGYDSLRQGIVYNFIFTID